MKVRMKNKGEKVWKDISKILERYRPKKINLFKGVK